MLYILRKYFKMFLFLFISAGIFFSGAPGIQAKSTAGISLAAYYETIYNFSTKKEAALIQETSDQTSTTTTTKGEAKTEYGPQIGLEFFRYRLTIQEDIKQIKEKNTCFHAMLHIVPCGLEAKILDNGGVINIHPIIGVYNLSLQNSHNTYGTCGLATIASWDVVSNFNFIVRINCEVNLSVGGFSFHDRALKPNLAASGVLGFSIQV